MRDDDGGLVLADLLDSSFGTGPDGLPTPSERLGEGRRALRHRRRALVAGTTAAVVATVGLATALSGTVGRGSDAGGPLPLATSGTSATPSADPSGSATLTTTELQASLERLSRQAQRAHRDEQELVSNQFPASYAADGRLVVKDGWRVTQRVEEPMGFRPPEASLGVVVTNGSDTRWMLLTLENMVDGQGNPTGAQAPTAAADDPGKGYSRFDDWLASMVVLNGPRDGSYSLREALIAVSDLDDVQPLHGARLDVRPMPVVDGYTSPGDRMVQARRDGRTSFVLIRGHGPDAEIITVDADLLPEPTFAAFVDHVRDQVASGEGLR